MPRRRRLAALSLGLAVVAAGCCDAAVGPAGTQVTRTGRAMDPLVIEDILEALDLCAYSSPAEATEVLGSRVDAPLPGGEGVARDCHWFAEDDGYLLVKIDAFAYTDVINETVGEPVTGVGARAWFVPSLGELIVETSGPRIYVRAARGDRDEIDHDDLLPIAERAAAGVEQALRGVADAD